MGSCVSFWELVLSYRELNIERGLSTVPEPGSLCNMTFQSNDLRLEPPLSEGQISKCKTISKKRGASVKMQDDTVDTIKTIQTHQHFVNAIKHIDYKHHRNTTLHRRLLLKNHHEALLIGTLLRRGCWRRRRCPEWCSMSLQQSLCRRDFYY